jgi:hypothetical protein
LKTIRSIVVLRKKKKEKKKILHAIVAEFSGDVPPTIALELMGNM